MGEVGRGGIDDRPDGGRGDDGVEGGELAGTLPGGQQLRQWLHQIGYAGAMMGRVLQDALHRTDVRRVGADEFQIRPQPRGKTAEEILDSLARYLQRISGAEH
ncbi:hypothetical protein NWFMUON74_39280 [Nocardia wallacei]|uniref:Uncharacterized protein n=1 Tax=Nocardia wallacei TaxID=480035 RepID=A0A7G1KNH2_9NOCA|nr:hypothetical protein NWFMUON74_39280 [Nocardia wallacei]